MELYTIYYDGKSSMFHSAPTRQTRCAYSAEVVGCQDVIDSSRWIRCQGPASFRRCPGRGKFGFSLGENPEKQ